jgi:hypothetical protein
MPTTPPRNCSVQGHDVVELGEDPEPGTVGLGVVVDGRVGAEVGEPLVRDALGEHVPVEQIDVGELHASSRRRFGPKI